MIKIDGEKIKKLRESQRLTQLYMATAVEVTTDTISRWENKRYPTIKEENAQKLAESLGVELAEILLVEEESENPLASVDEHSPQQHIQKPAARNVKNIIIACGIVAILSALYFVYTFTNSHTATPAAISVARTMPANAISGSPFPVVIEVLSTGNQPISIILKETLPANSEILKTSPKAGSSTDLKEAKWIHKLQGTTRFSYLIKINGTPGKKYTFNGSLSTSQGDSIIEVTGENSVQLGKHHWADSNEDNQISDQEILTVFDYYSGIDDFTIDIEIIEKMWLGSKYTWDSTKNNISITP